MSQRSVVSLVAVLIVASVSPALAASPLTLERHQEAVERVASPFVTLPGRTLCVCQIAHDNAQTFVGYLDSFVHTNGSGVSTVNMVCAYPTFNAAGGGAYLRTLRGHQVTSRRAS